MFPAPAVGSDHSRLKSVQFKILKIRGLPAGLEKSVKNGIIA